jgi:hypothetical protein
VRFSLTAHNGLASACAVLFNRAQRIASAARALAPRNDKLITMNKWIGHLLGGSAP